MSNLNDDYRMVKVMDDNRVATNNSHEEMQDAAAFRDRIGDRRKVPSKGFTHISVVGEFNDWSTSATPMKRLKNGAFSATVKLEKGRSHQFRYLLGQSHWENDPDADGYSPTPFGDSQNSVINL